MTWNEKVNSKKNSRKQKDLKKVIVLLIEIKFQMKVWNENRTEEEMYKKWRTNEYYQKWK